MRFTRSLCQTLILGWTLALLAMVNYEVIAKSPSLVGRNLPGWNRAQRVDVLIPWITRTGFKPLDKAMHEAEEAMLFYHLIPE